MQGVRRARAGPWGKGGTCLMGYGCGGRGRCGARTKPDDPGTGVLGGKGDRVEPRAPRAGEAPLRGTFVILSSVTRETFLIRASRSPPVICIMLDARFTLSTRFHRALPGSLRADFGRRACDGRKRATFASKNRPLGNSLTKANPPGSGRSATEAQRCILRNEVRLNHARRAYL